MQNQHIRFEAQK